MAGNKVRIESEFNAAPITQGTRGAEAAVNAFGQNATKHLDALNARINSTGTALKSVIRIAQEADGAFRALDGRLRNAQGQFISGAGRGAGAGGGAAAGGGFGSLAAGAIGGVAALAANEIRQQIGAQVAAGIAGVRDAASGRRFLQSIALEQGQNFAALSGQAAGFGGQFGRDTGAASGLYAQALLTLQQAGRPAGLSADQLVRGINDLAAARGVSSDRIPELLSGILLNDESLNRLGLPNPGALVQQRAASRGLNAANFTDEQKNLEILNAVMEAATRNAGAAARALDDPIAKLDQVSASFAAIRTGMTEMVLGSDLVAASLNAISAGLDELRGKTQTNPNGTPVGAPGAMRGFTDIQNFGKFVGAAWGAAFGSNGGIDLTSPGGSAAPPRAPGTPWQGPAFPGMLGFMLAQRAEAERTSRIFLEQFDAEQDFAAYQRENARRPYADVYARRDQQAFSIYQRTDLTPEAREEAIERNRVEGIADIADAQARAVEEASRRIEAATRGNAALRRAVMETPFADATGRYDERVAGIRQQYRYGQPEFDPALTGQMNAEIGAAGEARDLEIMRERIKLTRDAGDAMSGFRSQMASLNGDAFTGILEAANRQVEQLQRNFAGLGDGAVQALTAAATQVRNLALTRELGASFGRQAGYEASAQEFATGRRLTPGQRAWSVVNAADDAAATIQAMLMGQGMSAADAQRQASRVRADMITGAGLDPVATFQAGLGGTVSDAYLEKAAQEVSDRARALAAAEKSAGHLEMVAGGVGAIVQMLTGQKEAPGLNGLLTVAVQDKDDVVSSVTSQNLSIGRRERNPGSLFTSDYVTNF